MRYGARISASYPSIYTAMTVSPFVEPEYSRKQVQRSGKSLCNDQLAEDCYADAVEVLSNWRGAHRYILSIYNNRFRQMLKRHGIEAIVSSRLKRTPSIIAKLKRFPAMNLARMGDITAIIYGGYPLVQKALADGKSMKEAISAAFLKNLSILFLQSVLLHSNNINISISFFLFCC